MTTQENQFVKLAKIVESQIHEEEDIEIEREEEKYIENGMPQIVESGEVAAIEVSKNVEMDFDGGESDRETEIQEPVDDNPNKLMDSLRN